MTITQLRYAIAVSNARSMNEASRELFISQPSLSAAIKELEEEIGTDLFRRTNRGIQITPEGKEFIGYARQVVEQYELLESRYVTKDQVKTKFSVSAQHYTFAVQAYVNTVRTFGMDKYEFAISETKTSEVIDDVKNFRSEIGILYLNDLVFNPLMDCHIYVYMSKNHPLAGRESIKLQELDPYPLLSFDQGQFNSFYFSEEVLSTYDYKQVIKCNDRATVLNLMIGLNGYTLCSGLICEDLNGSDYTAVRLKSSEIMRVGYLIRRGIALSPMGQRYVQELEAFKNQVLD